MQRIEEMQTFWTTHAGAAALLDAHPLLCHVPRDQLLATIRTGCAFHKIWECRSIGELRGLIDERRRELDGQLTPELAELESVCNTRGGMRAQARAVGMLLFRAAARAFEDEITARRQALSLTIIRSRGN